MNTDVKMCSPYVKKVKYKGNVTDDEGSICVRNLPEKEVNKNIINKIPRQENTIIDIFKVYT